MLVCKQHCLLGELFTIHMLVDHYVMDTMKTQLFGWVALAIMAEYIALPWKLAVISVNIAVKVNRAGSTTEINQPEISLQL